ncbi:hypothetical protein ACSBR1_028353 [Camellia fascicularis]
MDSNSVTILDSPRDKDRLPKSAIFIHLEVFLHSRTLVPYPLILDSDFFGDNLGLAEIISAQLPGHCAHVMAMAVQKLFPDAKVTIGPWIENGFYYDFDMEPLTDKDLKRIKKEMWKIMKLGEYSLAYGFTSLVEICLLLEKKLPEMKLRDE